MGIVWLMIMALLIVQAGSSIDAFVACIAGSLLMVVIYMLTYVSI